MSGSKIVTIGKNSFVSLTCDEKTLATPGVNFINVLRAAFTRADPESVIIQSNHSIFYAFGI